MTNPTSLCGENRAEIALWPGRAPGSETWEYRERRFFAPPPLGFGQVRNVVTPTVTPYLPSASIATGQAVIVCPGGAFHTLAIDHEGHDVARWLVERGVAAFVLKYRVVRTSEDDDEFERAMQAMLQEVDTIASRTAAVIPLSVADAAQAMRLVRRRAAEWQVREDRIGILGFSAGAHVTLRVALSQEAECRPNMVALIYGGMWGEPEVSAEVPALFVAAAMDDPLLPADQSLALVAAWRRADRPVELHLYAQGGHGFGMVRQGLPSDHWIEQFGTWLESLR